MVFSLITNKKAAHMLINKKASHINNKCTSWVFSPITNKCTLSIFRFMSNFTIHFYYKKIKNKKQFFYVKLLGSLGKTEPSSKSFNLSLSLNVSFSLVHRQFLSFPNKFSQK